VKLPTPRSATLQRLRRRTVPTWWSDAKLGIFIHWGVASVPAYAPPDVDPHDMLTMAIDGPNPIAENPYAEWYWNSIRFPDSSAARYHREHHAGRTFESFAQEFNAGLAHWDPEDWADRFARAGARYVVLVTKHHDGYCLWPTEVAHPLRSGWHTERDLVGELADAVRARGLHFGVYYSGGLDWTFDDRPIGLPADLLTAVPHTPEYCDYAEAQVRELIERYRPSVVWNDIAWPFGGERLWQLFADYYAAVPDGVVNDRFQPRRRAWDALERPSVQRAFNAAARRAVAGGVQAVRPPFFDHLTPEYTSFDRVPRHPWETCRGIDRSFGYNRASRPEHFLSRDDLLGSFADIVARGGNLLLNVGPRGTDGSIPDEQQQRLDWLGEWLGASGPSVFGTRPWVLQEARSPEGHRLRFTASGDDVHVLVEAADDDAGHDRVTLEQVAPGAAGSVTAADGAPLQWRVREDGRGVEVELAGPRRSPWPLALTITRAVALPTPPLRG